MIFIMTSMFGMQRAPSLDKNEATPLAHIAFNKRVDEPNAIYDCF